MHSLLSFAAQANETQGRHDLAAKANISETETCLMFLKGAQRVGGRKACLCSPWL